LQPQLILNYEVNIPGTDYIPLLKLLVAFLSSERVKFTKDELKLSKNDRVGSSVFGIGTRKGGQEDVLLIDLLFNSFNALSH